LQQRLVEANGAAAVFGVLSQELVDALARIGFSTRPVVTHALAAARDAPEASVADLAKSAGLDAKRLIRLFVDDVGLTPKLYLRIARFERLLSDVFPRRTVDWSIAASEHGYFDQSHLIHDFREFADMTPTEYQERRGLAEHHARA
jgi:methylphosphotriester-DNA--protein-cysteine methyltransferase